MSTVHESTLGTRRHINVTVGFPSSRVTTGQSETIEFVTGPGGTPGSPGPPGPQGEWTSMTQAAYDALPTKDPNCLYIIIG